MRDPVRETRNLWLHIFFFPLKIKGRRRRNYNKIAIKKLTRL